MISLLAGLAALLGLLLVYSSAIRIGCAIFLAVLLIWYYIKSERAN